ncbi:MAG: monovalent cation/H+ antiporter subunit D [Jhaorihella sp.]
MNHWIIAPVVLPAVLAPFIIMVLRHHLDLERIFSVAGTLVLVVVTLALMGQAADGTIQVYELGAWPAPFGIVLVLDRLAAMMIVLTSLLALVVLLYAIGTGWDERGRHFHALFQFQLMGVLGAFLTGDAFNLFVFFEVLLIASYGLMIHGGGGRRLRAGVQYVVYNLIGSALFLLALGTLYAVTGTLNMADLAVRVAELSSHDTSLIRVGAVLLLLVFAIKAAVLPLHFWLPATYANAPLPVAALFSIMTKVGTYAILRMYTLVFGPDLAITHGLASDWLLPAALATLAVGSVGILGAREIARLVAFGAIASVGTLLIAVSLFTPQAAAAAIYYTVHSTLAAAALFLIADLVMERRGGAIAVGPPMPQSGLIAAFFFVGAIAMVGMPPLSGYVGKLLVMQAALGTPQVWWTWAVILVSSLIALAGMARAGSILFWKPFDPRQAASGTAHSGPDSAPGSGPGSGPGQTSGSDPEPPAAPPVPALPFVAVSALLAGLVALTVLAGPAMDYADATAAQLFAPADYIGAVLKRP